MKHGGYVNGQDTEKSASFNVNPDTSSATANLVTNPPVIPDGTTIVIAFAILAVGGFLIKTT